MNDQQPTTGPIAKRYGAAFASPDSQDIGWNSTLDTLLDHRSVRHYLTTELPAGTLETLVAAASSAASSSNMQLWTVIAVTDPARKARLAGMVGNQAHIEVAPLFLVWLADLSRAERLGLRLDRTMEALPFTETFVTAVVDVAIAGQNAVVAAESLGLGTVYIGAIRNEPEAVAAELGLPPGVVAVFGLCVGYADPEVASGIKPRLAPSVILHHEQYGTMAEADGIEVYEEALKSFQVSQSLEPVGWLRAVLSRLGRVSGLSGRDRLREALQRMGFGLK
jgi:nitroreductase